MREIGEQWVENGRMYKAVEGQGCENCWGCHWSDANSGCDSMVVCPVNASETGLIVKDLGPVNGDGLLAEERTGLFPKISSLDIDDCVWVADVYDGFVTVMAYGNTKQEAVDAWNRRV